MRRKQGELVPLELNIINVAKNLYKQGIKEFHGYQIAKLVYICKSPNNLTGYGTLYRALQRLVRFKILKSRWENYSRLVGTKRPRRRYYRLIKSHYWDIPK